MKKRGDAIELLEPGNFLRGIRPDSNRRGLEREINGPLLLARPLPGIRCSMFMFSGNLRWYSEFGFIGRLLVRYFEDLMMSSPRPDLAGGTVTLPIAAARSDSTSGRSRTLLVSTRIWRA